MSLLQKIYTQFKRRGLSINADAGKALDKILRSEAEVDDILTAILDNVADRIEKREITSSVIDKEAIAAIVAFMTSTEDDLNMESTELFNAFNSPRIDYDERNKTYKVTKKPSYHLHGTVESRARMFRDRLLMTQQRLLRTGEFALKGMSAPGGQGREEVSAKHELSTVESLLGDRGSQRVLLGIITQPEEGVWHLEDLTSSIPMDMSSPALALNGLITEGCIVVVEGMLTDGAFRIEFMGLPPGEERYNTLNAIGTRDTFGTGLRGQQWSQMMELEEEDVNTFFVILADVQLDRPQVLEKLNKVFEGFSDVGGQPVFVLMGSFIENSLVTSKSGKDAAIEAFSSLADTICRYPDLAEHAKFILIPGPTDPGTGAVMPLRPLPQFLVKELSSRVKHVKCGTDPCRLRFFTQEIVFFRDDIMRKMRRHAIKVPHAAGAEEGVEEGTPDIAEQLVETLLRQAHLCPLPLTVRPIYWELDYTMRLFPLPDLLVLADRTDQYALDCWGCNTVNPGSFSSDFSFVVYRPCTRSVEFSRVD